MLLALKNTTTIAMIMLFVTACGQEQDSAQPQYHEAPKAQSRQTYYFAVHPLHNPEKLQQAYQPLMDHLNRSIREVHFELEASRDYQVYETKIRARQPEFLLPNPWQTLQALKVGYSVIAEAGDSEDFKGIFIVRKDSAITSFADVRGKTVSYPSPTAVAAAIMPQYLLHRNGIDVNRDINNKYVGSQESSIMNAYLKSSDIAATWPPPWRLFQKDHPDEAAQLKVIWQTEPLINNSVMVRDDIPAPIAGKVRALLTGLHSDPQGGAILSAMETARFKPANDASYAVVQAFITRFEKEVRPVEQR